MFRFIAVLVFVLLPSVICAATPCTMRFEMFDTRTEFEKQVDAHKKAIQQAPRQHVQSYSMVYNFEGDFNPSNAFMADHLRRVHGINPAGMTRAEMAMAHDRAHGVNVRVPAATPRTITKTQQFVSGCPGGVCPLSSKSRRRR